jgi:hypothetical protein
MTPLMEKTLEAIRGWPRNRQDAAAELLLALDRLRPSAHRASAEELAAIDEALEQVARGERASQAKSKTKWREAKRLDEVTQARRVRRAARVAKYDIDEVMQRVAEQTRKDRKGHVLRDPRGSL